MAFITRLLLFAAANLAGYLLILAIPGLGMRAGLLPHFVTDMQNLSMREWYFVGSFFVLLACTLASTGYFFSQGRRRLLFLFAPMIITPLFSIAVLAHFSTHA
jgi:hypothetical protein